MSNGIEVIVTRKSTQSQLTVPHSAVLALLDSAGAERPDKDNPLTLGSPAKGKAHLVWGCIAKDGEEYSLIQGDTHGLWLSHQDGLGLAKLETLLQVLPIKGRAKVCVVSVRYVPAGTDPVQDEEVVEV